MSGKHLNYTDGALYASGRSIYVSPVKGDRGTTMGFKAADCASESIAVELARVYNNALKLGPFSLKRATNGARRRR